jgi:5-oxoprolinase (ATP-hydrolysing)
MHAVRFSRFFPIITPAMGSGSATDERWEFWVDVGGTFTDCLARCPDGALRTHKLLSSGAYRGSVGDGSTRECLVDHRRSCDPAGFYVGWRLVLFRPFACRAEHERTPPDAALGEHDPRHGNFEVFDTDIPVVGFEPNRGLLRLGRPLRCEPEAGWLYELQCDQEAPVIGVRWLLGRPLSKPVGPVLVRLGTTRGTNALLERRGAATALVTTAGFGDVLRIGYQQRPRLFDLHIRKPAPLYCEVVELEERVGKDGKVLRELDEAELRAKLAGLRDAGIDSLAVCLLNSYRNGAHELRAAQVARELGFRHVSISSQLSPEQRIVPRGETTVINAYLTPVIGAYLEALHRHLPEASIKMMTSAGGLVDAAEFVAKDSILSGPAAGVVGTAHAARAAGFDKAIGFDMGGTSTDVSRYGGQFERRYEMSVEDPASGDSIRIVAPVLAIETVAAGGGSICDFDGVKPVVGPLSAGAVPGPACYGRGGPLCLTDVNLFLGRIAPDLFPFPLDRGAVEWRLHEMIERIRQATGRRYDPYELAAGYVAIANAHMVAAIKKISVQRGYDPREHVLVSFGGAGGQHACAIACELGITRILAHPYAGVLSAFGIGMADVTRFAARDVSRPLTTGTLAALEPLFTALEAELRLKVEREGIPARSIAPARRLLDLRYVGQDAALTLEQPPDNDWRAAFEIRHQQLYGFTHPGRAVEVYTARLEVTGRTPKPRTPTPPARTGEHAPARHAPVYFDGALRETAIYSRDRLQPGDCCDGPALILEATGTIVVECGWHAEMTDGGDVLLTDRVVRRAAVPAATAVFAAAACDPITLELFNSQFAAIAEQMGAMLRRTALSTNIKERLDFSCAIYDAAGGLVAHAPHIPVHIGAMGHCVTCLIEERRGADGQLALRPGEVYVTNDPYRGGSHLPDVTVMTPVFDEQGREILFYAASRAHHAEIGGMAPGSMPPDSRSLAEEGIRIPLMPLVVREEGGAGRSASGVRIQDDELRRVLSAGPYPTRALQHNLADIHAQVAANQCGVRLLADLVTRSGLPTVRAYMQYIQHAAETKMRAALWRLPDGQRRFVDYLDDGSRIAVALSITGDKALIDFTGTGPVHPGNLNATPAIVASAVLYCFRCLIDEDIPLNAGVLAPLKIILPIGLLNPPAQSDPARCPAVAGGNVETSQRIVDCILGALGVVAASQGTMNNLSFGNERFGYYETIAGGAGAGPTFDGADAVHTHMTNTRLTDPEVLEDRYPVRLRRFTIRRGSGGVGRHRGGDGVVREIEFLEPLDVSLLTQRRTRRPYGLAGGEPGAAGENLLLPTDGEPRSLGSACQLRVRPGDVLRISTPGGGGYGEQPGPRRQGGLSPED